MCNIPYKGFICEYCRNENASWLSKSVHADCFNIGDGYGNLPKSERECMCNCAYN